MPANLGAKHSSAPFRSDQPNRHWHVSPQWARRLNPCVHQLFEHSAESTQESDALVGDGRLLSSHELNQRANALACKLRNLGVGPNTLVGLHAEPSLELVVGIIGILKAGGAYV